MPGAPRGRSGLTGGSLRAVACFDTRGGMEWFQARKSRSSWRSTISATCCGSRSAAVSPPPSAYRMTPAYRTMRQPSPDSNPRL